MISLCLIDHKQTTNIIGKECGSDVSSHFFRETCVASQKTETTFLLYNCFSREATKNGHGHGAYNLVAGHLQGYDTDVEEQ